MACKSGPPRGGTRILSGAMIAMFMAVPTTVQNMNFNLLPPTFWVDHLPLQLLANNEARDGRERIGPASPAMPGVDATTTT